MDITVEHNEIFDLAFRFVTETAENIFLTGKAGTGKTTFLKYLRENCTKAILVAAPTGVAAINAGGVTLHSLFQLPFHPFLPTHASKDELLKKIKYNKQRLQLLRKMELLVIDEISMVRCDTMDAIDTILRSVRRNYSAPFGGVQLLCIGDLHQLPPVAQNREWKLLQEYYASPFFFDSHAIKEQQPLLVQLEKIYRQKEQSFVDLLNNVRTNKMETADFEKLHERFLPGFIPPDNDRFITLTSHNNQANLLNNSEIQRLHTPSFVYEATVESDFPESMFPTDASLMLKEGAQVMFIKNDTIQKRYFNGKIGVVSALEKDSVIVDCDGEKISVFKEEWENSRYTLNKKDGKLEQEVIGSFAQYPLRLAWAITIHKSQGLTFERVMIDAACAFSSGQVYVALSRCTSLEGIVLRSKIPAAAIQSNSNVDKGHQTLSHRGSLAERFAGARAVYTQILSEEIFSFEHASEAWDILSGTILANKEKLNRDAEEWSRNLSLHFSDMKTTGLKFLRQVNALLKEENVIENNPALQDRLSVAAAHFIPLLEHFVSLLKTQPLITEHKEVADVINPLLEDAYQSFFAANYIMSYCKEPFSVTLFLRHKLNYAQPQITLTCYAGSRKVSNTDSPNPDLYDTLKRWRDMVCEDSGQPIYLVVTHAGLKDICTFLPKTKADLLLISGFGKAKVDKYGEEILDVVNDYCERNHLDSQITAIKTAPKKERKAKAPFADKTEKADTRELSFAMFNSGKSVREIAKERGLTEGTISSHLAIFVEKGTLDITRFLTESNLNILVHALNDRGEKTATDVKNSLPDFTYAEIKMAEAWLKFKENQPVS